MVTKFSRKELERIGRNEEEIELVMKYQKKLPVLNSFLLMLVYCGNN